MTEAQVIALINQYIIPNGTNAITGAVLNQVLIPMVQQINDKVGQLEDLETPVNTDIVAAINSILALINNGSTIHEGQANPNVTPPASYAIADFYSQVNASNNPIFLWIYTGTSWVNLSDEGLPVTQISSLNLFDDGSFETGIAGFAVSDGSGVLTSIEASLIAPRNQKMLRADMAATSAIERNLGIPVNYGGVPANFSCWVYTDDQQIEIDVMGGSTPITTIVVTPGDQWQHITYDFNVDNAAPPSLGIRVKNTNACIYNLDEMFLGAKTSEVAPVSSDISNYNLSANPSFENDIVEYSVITGSANFSFNNADNLLSPLNKRCLKIESDTGGEFKFLFAGNPINTGVKGVYEFWMLNDQEVIILISTTGGGSVTDLIPISNVWKKHSYTFNLGSGATDIGFAVASDSNTFLDMMYVGAMEALDKDLLIQVTVSEAQALIANSKLDKGATYEITNADPSADVFETGFTVWLTALSPNELSQDGQIRMYTPKYDDRPIWADGNVYAPGDKASWGGKVWDNLNGNVGTALDAFNLDFEWQFINIGDINWNDLYNVQLYPVGYDVSNDEILFITTLKGSNVYSNGKALGFGNPIKYYQWGNDFNVADYVGVSANINNSLLPIVNILGGYVTTFSMDGSYIITFSMEGSSYIGTFLMDGSYIDTFSMEGSSYIGTFSMEGSSYIITFSMEGSIINYLKISNCQIGDIITTPSTAYRAKIVMYGITGNPNIDFADYPKLLEPCTATFLQKSTGEIVVFYESADGGLSASEVIEPVNDEDYTQKEYVDEILHRGSIEIEFDGSQTIFEITHGYDVEPSSFALTFSDGSAIDFIQGDRSIDATNIIISCDAAPMVGSIIVYWQAFK